MNPLRHIVRTALIVGALTAMTTSSAHASVRPVNNPGNFDCSKPVKIVNMPSLGGLVCNGVLTSPFPHICIGSFRASRWDATYLFPGRRPNSGNLILRFNPSSHRFVKLRCR
jgi:hypothetical protein